ncbi:MAG: T9SS type A sorting domain-containing protein, partial [Ignavibacteriae bacterium]|nr:T9SS type A sorting domain-containing protein [Ignavibacteriota bacterium]
GLAEILIEIKQISEVVPSSYSLQQNYPNPFNSITKIHYELPKNGFVKLVVFDMLGREVETLVNEKQNEGTFEAKWNASHYSSGVYYYRLTMDGFSETKKMILIK